jgi:hypothetical protein
MKRKVRNIILVAFGFFLGLAVPFAWSAVSSQAQSSGNCQTFPQTGYTVCGKFLTYWQQHGGLAQQGYPISEEFVETSDLNGKPYTVQYFERAVFEMHPENQPPNDVELSQLGTFLGKENYVQGFPTTAGQTPFYEVRTDPVKALKSYYNAINRKEYERAYGYFFGAPNPLPSVAPPYNQFVQGYSDTTFTTLAVGNVEGQGAAGSTYATFPVVITATHTDNSTHVYSGCYTMRSINPGISQNPYDVLPHIYSAKLSEVPANSNVDQLLAQPCTQ